MGFYEDKRKAIKDIDNMLSDNISMDIIIYKINTKYGFTKTMILRRKEELDKLSEV